MIVDETLTNLKAALERLATEDPQLKAHLELPAPAAFQPATGEVRAATPEEAAAFQLEQANVQVATLEDGQVRLQTKAWAPPVIGSPLWFLEEVAEAYGQERTDYLVDELCGLKVIQREELSEPILVLTDGRTFTIVPEWARRTAEQLAAEDRERQAAAGRLAAEAPPVLGS